MKLLMENWRKYLKEDDNLRRYSLLTEQTFNDETFKQIKELFVKILNEGGTQKDLLLLVEQEPNLSRRSFLKKAATAAGAVAASQMIPSVARAGMKKHKHDHAPTGPAKLSKIKNHEIIQMIESLKDKSLENWKPTNPDGSRIVAVFADKIFNGDQKTAADAYMKSLYPNIVKFIKKFPYGFVDPSTLPKNAYASISTGQYDDGQIRPIQLQLNSNFPWDNEEKFKAQAGISRMVGLTHEFEHLMEGTLEMFSGGKFILTSIATAELGKIFNLPNNMTRSGGFEGDFTLNQWSNELGELYADFKALRTRLGGNVTKEDLDILCDHKNLVTRYGVDYAKFPAKEYKIHTVFLRMLKCPATREAIDASNRFASLDKKIGQQQAPTTRYAEAKNKNETPT